MGVCNICRKHFNRLDAHQRASVCGQKSSSEDTHQRASVCGEMSSSEDRSADEETMIYDDLDSNGENFNTEEEVITNPDTNVDTGSVENMTVPLVTDDDLLEEFMADCRIPSVTTRSRHRTEVMADTGLSDSSSLEEVTETEQAPTVEKIQTSDTETVINDQLQSGRAFLVTDDFDVGRFCFNKKDCAMMRLYHICDKANTPRYLADQIMAHIKDEMLRNDFDPCDPSITKRDAFMARMHKKFPSPPAEAIKVKLESFPEEVTMYRFDVVKQLQDHLLRADLYRDLGKLNVNQENPWDQSCRPPFKHYNEVTDGTWYKAAIEEHLSGQPISPPNDLEDRFDDFIRFIITLELYTDSTGTDQKESFSLEPVLMSTGLLQSEFVGKPGSRFIVGYIPSLSNMKSSAAQSKKKSTVSGFGCNVRDYHKCLSILLEPLVLAQKKSPLMTVVLGEQVRRVRAVLLMGPILGDGKSQDMICSRVMSYSKTLRLSRATLTPSCVGSETKQAYKWIKSSVIQLLTRGALFSKCKGNDRKDWNTFMNHPQHTAKIKTKYVAASKRRERICNAILRYSLGSHAAINAFSLIDMASDLGVYGHTLSDVMHLLEEGIFKYLEFTLLAPLSETVLAEIDKLVAELFGMEANRCHGSNSFPRVNFTRGFTRLTLLSSSERVGVLIAIVLLLRTEHGRNIFEPRFAKGFDAKRKEAASRFSNPNEPVDDDRQAFNNLGRDEVGVDEDSGLPGETAEQSIGEQELLAGDSPRRKQFEPTRENIEFICEQIENHDLAFVFTEIFPEIPNPHVYKCLEVVWEVVYSIRNEDTQKLILPQNTLDIPSYGPNTYQPGVLDSEERSNSTREKLYDSFVGCQNRGMPIPVDKQGVPVLDPDVEEQPTITQDIDQFLECCELLLALRSFYSYAGTHCPESIPMAGERQMDLHVVKQRTKHVADSLKAAVNRGEGTNQWNIPKFIDLMLLPEYMHFMGSLGRMHLGWAESGLKTWAKMPANTAQKRKGGIFEGQCAARIRETSMMDHAVNTMKTQVDYMVEQEQTPIDDGSVGEGPFLWFELYNNGYGQVVGQRKLFPLN
jgi:hypothetical protein